MMMSDTAVIQSQEPLSPHEAGSLLDPQINGGLAFLTSHVSTSADIGPLALFCASREPDAGL